MKGEIQKMQMNCHKRKHVDGEWVVLLEDQSIVCQNCGCYVEGMDLFIRWIHEVDEKSKNKNGDDSADQPIRVFNPDTKEGKAMRRAYGAWLRKLNHQVKSAMAGKFWQSPHG